MDRPSYAVTAGTGAVRSHVEVACRRVLLADLRPRFRLVVLEARGRPLGWLVATVEHPRRLACCAVGNVLPRRRYSDRHTEDGRCDRPYRFGACAAADQQHAAYRDSGGAQGL